MGVLTQKEYKKKLLEINKEDQVKQRAFEVKTEKAPVEPEKEFEYILLYPENPAGNYKNFEDEVDIAGKKYKRICRGGIIKTKEKVLSDFLVSVGHELLETLEVKKC